MDYPTYCLIIRNILNKKHILSCFLFKIEDNILFIYFYYKHYLIMSDNSEPSICIPRTLNNITRDSVKNVFESIFGINSIDRVDIIINNIDRDFCKIFVHFKYWSNDEEIIAIRNRLSRGDNIKIVHDPPRFWKCSASRTIKPYRYIQSHSLS